MERGLPACEWVWKCLDCFDILWRLHAGWQPAFRGEKMENETPKGWYSRGYLPHFDNGVATQFLTYRLADSLPQKVLRKYQLQLDNEEIDDRDFNIKVDKYLDNGIGECYLNQERIAEIVEENLLRFDGEKYKLHAIMPNHLHLLLSPRNNFTLSQIVHSSKSYTSNKANKLLNRTGRFWFPEPFDRFIRDYEHFEKTYRYIINNPVKAGLCKIPEEWRFSSAWHEKSNRNAGCQPASNKGD